MSVQAYHSPVSDELYRAKHYPMHVRVIGRANNGRVIGEYMRGHDLGRIGEWPADVFLAFYELAPPKIVRYVNIYDNGETATHESRTQADEFSASDRIACIRIEFEKGQMDP